MWGLGEEGCGVRERRGFRGGMRQVGNVGGREYGSWGVGEVEQVGSGGGGEGGDGEGGDGEGRGEEGGGGRGGSKTPPQILCVTFDHKMWIY